ncbi:hypothetical protein [Streptomyces sp. NPDC007100]|uniref:hypothetical protein n=1 Tax=Streptomyces sp. NPDC007100 TaxID=3155602 RepID=UPI0033F0E9CF
MQEFTDAEIEAQAVHLGLIQDGEELPRHLRGRVVAALMEERRARKAPVANEPARPQLAREIVVQPSGSILIDGAELPWLAGQDPIDIHVQRDGSGSVRLTLLAASVQITPRKPDNESESAS